MGEGGGVWPAGGARMRIHFNILYCARDIDKSGQFVRNTIFIFDFDWQSAGRVPFSVREVDDNNFGAFEVPAKDFN